MSLEKAPYFVMIHNQKFTGLVPLVHDDEVLTFETPAEAHEAAQNNDMALSFGYDVFEAGAGIDEEGGRL